jgi:UDP-N-acetylglucosamine 1-carboxyvinyltransferase
VRIFGPAHLHGAAVDASDLRAGATLVIAALAAEGESTVSGVHHIERGYQGFAQRLQSLGAMLQVESRD